MMKSAITPLKRFKKLLEIDSKDITQVYIYALFNGLVNLSLPIGIQAIINLIQGGEISTAWMVLVGFVIAGVALTGILQLLQLRIVENIAQKIFSRASFEFAYRIPKIKRSALFNYYAPELTNRFFDTLTIQKGLPKILIDFSLALFQIVVGLVLLSFYHSFFILFSLVLVALVYIIIAITGPIGLKTSLSESKSKYKIAFWLEEIARTKLSFKLISRSNLNLEKTNKYLSQYLESRETHFRVLIRQFLYLIGFKVVIAAGLLITGSILVFNQEMNIGQFVAAEIIIILIIASVEKLIQSLDSIYDVLTALEKIGYVTDMELETYKGMSLDQNAPDFEVRVNNITFRYPEAVSKTIDNLSLKLPVDSSIIVKGASGSGKSTLLHLLAGVLEPQSGNINYNGFPLKSLDTEELRSHLGFVLNSSEIFQGTILENITMSREGISTEDISDTLAVTKMMQFISTMPLGLNTTLDPEGKKLPRSIKNKILLARAIVTKPKLLILENPLSDVQNEDKHDIIKKS